jgi:uncharacterized protein DUF3800
MKTPKSSETHFFVDEAGDPTFYNSKGRLIVGEGGCSRLLALGLIETQDPRAMRQAVLDLHREVLNDSYLQKIPSFADTSIAFHANKDCPEVRYLVYRMIGALDFRAQFVVSCKSETVFKEKHHSEENQYYDDMVARLFQNCLHRFEKNTICFSSRGSRDRRRPLERAIENARTNFMAYYGGEKAAAFAPGIAINILAQSPKGEPCLSVIDYVAWALQRAYVTRQMRYYDFIADKVSYILELKEAGTAHYSRKNPFDINKAALLQLGSS